jgi:hypothetical protein
MTFRRANSRWAAYTQSPYGRSHACLEIDMLLCEPCMPVLRASWETHSVHWCARIDATDMHIRCAKEASA